MSDPLAIRTEDLRRVFRAKRREAKKQKREVVALDGVSILRRPRESCSAFSDRTAPARRRRSRSSRPCSRRRRAVRGSPAWTSSQTRRGVRRHIGMVSGGETSGYGLLTVEENLWMFSQFYGLDTHVARKRIKELLAVVGLSRPLADEDLSPLDRDAAEDELRARFPDRAGDPVPRRADARTRRADRAHLRGFVSNWLAEHRDRTILLTTHAMHEADELCDRVAIIDKGKILACDAPAALKRESSA